MSNPINTTLAFLGSADDALRDAQAADAARRESEERLRVAIEAAALGTWDFYPKSGELRWSNRCKALFGLPADAPVTYDTFLAGLHPDDRMRGDNAVKEALEKDNGRFNIEYRTVGLIDNVERWIHATGKAYRENGEVVRFVGTVEDISDRKYAEADRDRFFYLGADFVVVAGFDGFFRRVSPNWETVFGWTEAEMLANDWLSFVHPDDVAATIAMAEAQREKAEVAYQFENRYRTKQGEYRWLSWKAITYLDEKRIYGGATDITDRKQAEAAMRENEARLSILTRATSDVIWDWDLGTNQVWWNDGLSTLFGYQGEHADKDGAWWRDHIHPEDRERVFSSIKTAIAVSRKLWTETYRFRKADGGYLTVRDTGYAITGVDGNVIRMVGAMQDVTDKLESEQALAEAQKESGRLQLLYETALSNTPDFIYIFDLKGRFIYANQALLEMWGRTRADAIGKRCIELGYPDWHAEMHEREIDTVVTTRAPIKGEIPFTGTHGRRIYEYIFSPVIGQNGEVVAVAGTTRDVTEHSEIEREFRELADSMPQMIWVTQPDGFHEYYNKRWYEFTGVPEDSTDGEAWNGMFHPEDQERAWKRWRHSLESGEPYEIEYRLRRYDGVYRWVLGRALPARDAEGRITKWYGTCTDISEQLEREEFISSVVESSPDCVKVLDLNGGLLSMNQNGMDQMEIDDIEFCLNRPWDSFWEGEHREKALNAYHAAKKGKISRFEGMCLTAKGTPKWWEVVVAPVLDKDGTPLRLLSISRDITERRELTNQLEIALKEAEAARDYAEEANLAKSEFLANMSHEIRTPMNAVIGLSNILAASRPLSDQQKDFIGTLQTSADSLLALINDLLDIAKIETRHVELERIPFQLTRLTEEVVSMMAMRAKEKGLAFTMDAKCAEGRTYLGDPTRIRQIILNLCSNAVKFTEKGKIDITVHCHDEGERDIDTIDIIVSDTGIGIARDKLNVVFQKFVQADNSINRKYGGSGLGLTITKTLAEIMGGTIEVESVSGEGSTFTVHLPLTRTADSKVIKKNTNAAITDSPRFARILLVEDYAPNVLVATTFLSQFGYEHDVATNGADALALIQKQDYSVVLMDVQMHGMNGFETTQQVRIWERDTNRPRLAIVGMTAHALTGDRERCIAVGMDDYISKPFDPDELKEKLAFYCTARRARQ